MARKSWQLDRRTFLRGTGVALGLPFLDCMQAGSVLASEAQRPKRMCSIYFPYGASVPGDDHADRDWGWFPVREGDQFRYTNVMKPLESLRQHVSVIGGLSHPSGRDIGGHDTGDIFLTGASFEGGNFQNSVSFDQVAAARFGHETRFPSLVLSSDGGTGLPTRARTLSFTASGQPIPSLNQPQQIFERLFGDEEGTKEQTRRRLAMEASMFDLLLEDSKRMRRNLGTHDQRKYDEYLSSVRDIEKRVQLSEHWLDIPKEKVDQTAINLEATADAPLEYIRTMYDLLYLAFQTDSTRIATYMLGSMDGKTSDQFSKALGLGSQHELAHNAGKQGGFTRQGEWNQCLIENLANFLQRLASTNDGNGNMLDNTMVLMGTSNSRTHDNHNYPLVFAGGANMGIKQGQYLTCDANGEDVPMSNLLFTILNQMGVAEESFSDSTGNLSELC